MGAAVAEHTRPSGKAGWTGPPAAATVRGPPGPGGRPLPTYTDLGGSACRG
jgi:hypothetical protein